MARGSATYTQSQGSPAAYKAWGQAISGILNQASPRTADTGQVNWASVVAEPSTVRDFEVFPMGGPLQATAPIFLRFDYQGSASGGLFLTVGTSTDGAGNLGGLLVPKVGLQNGIPGVWSNVWGWASSDNASYFTLLYNMDPLTTGAKGQGMCVIERTRDLAGDPTGAGFHVWRWQAASTTATWYLGGWTKVFGAQSQSPAVDFNFASLLPDLVNTASAFVGNVSYAFPAYTAVPPFAKGASKALMFGFPNDWPRGQSIAVDHYGEAMTFVSVGDAMRNAFPVMTDKDTTTAVKYLAPIMRWD